MSVVSAGQDMTQTFQKGLGAQLLFEFLLYLIRKWFPDAHGAHPEVCGVGESGHDPNVPKGPGA